VVAAEFVSSTVDSGNEVESCPVQSGNSPYYVYNRRATTHSDDTRDKLGSTPHLLLVITKFLKQREVWSGNM